MKNYLLAAASFSVALLLSGCNETGKRIENADTVSEMVTPDTAVVFNNNTPWDATSYDKEPVIEAPDLSKDKIELRGTDLRSVYAMADDILFDTDKAQLRSAADDKLKKISTSIRDRMQDGKVRIEIYGHTDSRAGKDYNKDLGRDRAQAVAQWLTNNGDFDKSKIAIESKGETEPVATNATAEGRQENRRVEIVVQRI